MSVTTDCRICGHNGPHTDYRAREMMLGTRDVFAYFECSQCGTVQLAEIPADLAAYYPNDYYSFQIPDMPPTRGVLLLLKKLRADYLLTGRGLVGKILSKKFGCWDKFAWLRAAGAKRADALLDIGCGSGRTLLQLRNNGFISLTGADPFISGDIEYPGPIRIRKCFPHEISGKYDIVMMDHAFEHVPNPAEVMDSIARLLRPGGRAIIGIPVAAWAWRHYLTDWVELDAPRHLFIFTPGGIALLAQRAELRVVKTIYDSSAFQFFGSEMYRRDIPLTRVGPDGKRYSLPATDFFSEGELTEFAARAVELNRNGEGGRACFILTKD